MKGEIIFMKKLFVVILGLVLLFSNIAASAETVSTNTLPVVENKTSELTEKDLVSTIRNGELELISEHEIKVVQRKVLSETVSRSFDAPTIREMEVTNVSLVSIEANQDQLERAYTLISTSNNDQYRETTDGSYSAVIGVRIYYTEYRYSDGRYYYGLQKVTGTIEGQGFSDYLGSNVYIVRNSARCGQFGFTRADGYKSLTQDYTFGVSTRSWTKTLPSNWRTYAVANTTTNKIGCTYTITLRRGSDWNLVLSNNLW